MVQLISILKVVFSLIPVIIDVIKALEKAFPAAGLGTEKIFIVRQAFEQVYGMVQENLPDMEKVWSGISKTITVLVALFNKTGAFSEPVAAPPVDPPATGA